MQMEELCTEATLGAINTYINMINEESEEFGDGRQIVQNQYLYAVTPSGNFHLFITVDELEKEIVFEKDEWLGLGKNMLGNQKLKNLYHELVSA